MTEQTIDKVPQRIRDLFNKGFTALERGNVDYALDLLHACIEAEPAFLQARKYLRAAELQRLKKSPPNAVKHQLAMLTGLPLYLGASLLLGKQPAKALLMAEKLLRADALNLSFINLFVRATRAADLLEAGVQTLEMVREYYPLNPSLCRDLGELYQESGNMRAARECFERLCQLRPNDQEAIRALKNAMALDSMKTDGWEDVAKKGGSFRDMVKDSKESVLLEQKGKAMKTDADAADLIADMLAKLEKEPQNINYYRSLARLYDQRHLYDESLQTIAKARIISPGDPELDNLQATIRTHQFDAKIAELQAAGDTAGAEARAIERAQFVFDDLQERVKRYPTDLKLRFELGIMLYENDYTNEAIQQFQMAQRSPKQRTHALYYLGCCMAKKQQYDLALDQLESASSEILIMDDLKKSVLYELGKVSEAMGNTDKAATYYKQIYQVDIGYRDVSAKIEQQYPNQK